MKEVKIVRVESVEGKKRKPTVRKYILQTNGDGYIFREHLISGYEPCPLPEGCEVAYNINTKTKKKIPYLKSK